MPNNVRRLGWIPDTPDERDFKLKIMDMAPIRSVYLASKFKTPFIYDQGNLGSCTAQAVNFLVHFNLMNKNKVTPGPVFLPSRLFTYYYERFFEGTVNIDSGAELRSGIKVIAEYGAPSEDLWPYDIQKFALQPPQKAIDHGIQFQALTYERVDNTDKMLIVNCLMRGFPICFGSYVYYSFFSDSVEQTGIVPMPKSGEPIVGGHAMVIVGYRMEDDSFIVRNSWGKNWGQGGYCRIPAAYITDSRITGDCWTITMME